MSSTANLSESSEHKSTSKETEKHSSMIVKKKAARKRSFKKNPDAPKRFRSSYVFFIQEKHKKGREYDQIRNQKGVRQANESSIHRTVARYYFVDLGLLTMLCTSSSTEISISRRAQD